MVRDMRSTSESLELWTTRRPFRAWSIAVPVSFDEEFIPEHAYWQARDEVRSISLTSIEVDEGDRPVPAAELMSLSRCLDGVPVQELPAGLLGLAVEIATDPPAIASRALSGLLAVDGRILLVTITSDAQDWERAIWSTIRAHPAPPGPYGQPVH